VGRGRPWDPCSGEGLPWQENSLNPKVHKKGRKGGRNRCWRKCSGEVQKNRNEKKRSNSKLKFSGGGAKKRFGGGRGRYRTANKSRPSRGDRRKGGVLEGDRQRLAKRTTTHSQKREPIGGGAVRTQETRALKVSHGGRQSDEGETTDQRRQC